MADFDPRTPAQDPPPLAREGKAPDYEVRGASGPDAPSGGEPVRTVPLLVRSVP